MQIDFHHATTYVLARWAGFSHDEASTVAYSAQYVDDATNTGWVVFDGGEMYYRTASAHTTFALADNFDRQEDSHSWIPFHFLPGNGHDPDPGVSSLDLRLTCRKNSDVANALFRACVRDARSPFGGPHRLGITAHVYADTFAHDDFAGLVSAVNSLAGLSPIKPHLLNLNIPGLTPDLGHADALTYPDLPFLTWSYTKKHGSAVVRSNPDRFVEASRALHGWFVRYRAGDPDASPAGLTPAQEGFLANMFTGLTATDGDARHERLLAAIRRGDSPDIAPGTVAAYTASGPGSWKHQATGLTGRRDSTDEQAVFSPAFLTSDWKRFHDALQYHRLFVLNVLLPSFGICAG